MEYVEVARAESERGELVLRRAARPRRRRRSLELRANGVFVMDTRETVSERALATRRPGAGRPARARCWSAGSASGSRCTRCSRTRGSSGCVGRRDRAGAGRLDARRHRPARPRAARRRPGGGAWSPTSRDGARGGRRGGLRPGAARRRQRPRLPGPRRQRRALRRAVPRSVRRRAAARRRAASSGRPPSDPALHERAAPRCSATPRRLPHDVDLQGRARALLALPRAGTPRTA